MPEPGAEIRQELVPTGRTRSGREGRPGREQRPPRREKDSSPPREEEVVPESEYGSGFYATLKVRRNATSEEIKRAYRKLAREFHPDFNPGNSDAEEKMKELTEAYDTLSDEAKKRTYDFDLNMMGETMGRRRRGSRGTERSDTASEDSFETAFPRNEGESWKEYKQRVIKEFLTEAQTQGYRISPHVVEQWFYEDFTREHKERLRRTYDREGKGNFDQAYAQTPGETEGQYKKRLREQFKQDSGMSPEEADEVFAMFSSRMFPYSQRLYYPQREHGESRERHKERVMDFMKNDPNSSMLPEALDMWVDMSGGDFYDVFWPESEGERKARWESMSKPERLRAEEDSYEEEARQRRDRKASSLREETKEYLREQEKLELARAEIAAKSAEDQGPYTSTRFLAGMDPRATEKIREKYAEKLREAETDYERRYARRIKESDMFRPWRATVDQVKALEDAVLFAGELRHDGGFHRLPDGSYIRIQQRPISDKHFKLETRTVFERITGEKDQQGKYRSEGILLIQEKDRLEGTERFWLQRVKRDYKENEVDGTRPIREGAGNIEYQPLLLRGAVSKGEITKAITDLKTVDVSQAGR